MAAGMSINEENLQEFRSLLNRDCGLSENDLIEKIYVDMQLPPGMFTGEDRTGKLLDIMRFGEPSVLKNRLRRQEPEISSTFF